MTDTSGLPPGYNPETAAAATVEVEEKQDMHNTEPRLPDINWSPPVHLTVGKDRENAPHQIVTMRNTSRVQDHIILDRRWASVLLRPGEQRDIDMITSEIEYFLRERSPNRPPDAMGGRSLCTTSRLSE